MAIREKFKTFEGEWKDFLPDKDLAIPRLHAFIGLPERYLERIKVVDEGRMSTVESWYVALTIRLRILEEIWNEIAQHSPGIDTSISAMMSDVGAALDFEDIKEENVNEMEVGSRLDELGKVAIKKKHLGILASPSALSDMRKNMRRIMKRHYKQQAT